MRTCASTVRLRFSAAAAASCRAPHGALRCLRTARVAWAPLSLRTAHPQAAPPPSTSATAAEDDEDDVLVRLLVQDAFRPAPKVVAAVGATMATTAVRQTTETAQENESANDNRAGGFNEVDEEGSGTVAVGTADYASFSPSVHREEVAQATAAEAADAVTDIRRCHIAAEPFAVVRRRDAADAPSFFSAGGGGGGSGDKGVAEREERNLEWLCLECRAYNQFSTNVAACGSCAAAATLSYRAARPPVRHVALMPAVWVCTHCAHTNDAAAAKLRQPGALSPPPSASADQRSKFSCEHCGKPFSGVPDWTCPVCDHLAPRAATQCPTCLSQRPVKWTCRGCQHADNSVFSRRCCRCGLRRPSRRSNAVSGCAGCGNLNDVRWELCATCMAPCACGEAGPALGGPVHSAPTAATAPPLTPSVLRAAWGGLTDPLTRDARGFLRSKTTEGTQLLFAPPKRSFSSGATDAAARDNDAAAAVAARRTRAPMPLLDNAWCCLACNVPQRRNASFCDICLGSRDSMRRQMREAAEKAEPAGGGCGGAPASAAAVSGVPLTADGDWRCPYCSQLRGVEVGECCGHNREVPPGYWLCERCSSTNLQARHLCLGCGLARELVAPWRCAACAHRNSAGAVVCRQCGLPHAGAHLDASTASAVEASSVTCPVCAAPNLAVRQSCYRCRARLREVEWTCHACGHGNRDRLAVTCAACAAFRTFDLNQEVWVCEVCSTGVYSGGDLPVRTVCPKCEAPRAAAAPHIPARWRCSCGMYNRARLAECAACGSQRRMPTVDTVVSCPSCFRDARLDVAETCNHCGADLGRCFAIMDSEVTAALVNSARDAEHGAACHDPAVEDDEDVPEIPALANADVR